MKTFSGFAAFATAIGLGAAAAVWIADAVPTTPAEASKTAGVANPAHAERPSVRTARPEAAAPPWNTAPSRPLAPWEAGAKTAGSGRRGVGSPQGRGAPSDTNAVPRPSALTPAPEGSIEIDPATLKALGNLGKGALASYVRMRWPFGDPRTHVVQIMLAGGPKLDVPAAARTGSRASAPPKGPAKAAPGGAGAHETGGETPAPRLVGVLESQRAASRATTAADAAAAPGQAAKGPEVTPVGFQLPQPPPRPVSVAIEAMIFAVDSSRPLDFQALAAAKVLSAGAIAGRAADAPSSFELPGGVRFGMLRGDVGKFWEALESTGAVRALGTRRMLIEDRQSAVLPVSARPPRPDAEPDAGTVPSPAAAEEGVAIRPLVRADGVVYLELGRQGAGAKPLSPGGGIDAARTIMLLDGSTAVLALPDLPGTAATVAPAAHPSGQQQPASAQRVAVLTVQLIRQ